jgi:RHS repeat-associated protein
MRAWLHISVGRRPGRKFDIRVISGIRHFLWLGFRVRKLAKRVVGGENRQVEVLYPSMYFGLEKQKDSTGSELPNSVYSVNNIYLEGVRIAAVIPSGDARYYLTDQVNSVKVVADDNGFAVSRMEYMPYGETWFEEGDTNNAPKYNSQELDTESNFYYYNARHYDGNVSRFITPDKIIPNYLSTQTWNRFTYCNNNPVMYKDPTGHFSILAAIGLEGSTQKGVSEDEYARVAVSEKDGAKQNLEENLQKPKDSSNDRTASKLPGKDPDLVVKCTILGNEEDKHGNIIGVYGLQELSYWNSEGKEIKETHMVTWAKKPDEEGESEHPAHATKEPFDIVPKWDDKQRYPIQTKHPEEGGGIAIHGPGRSEGCIIASDKVLDDIKKRFNEKEILTGQITEIKDERNPIDQLFNPLPEGFMMNTRERKEDEE